MRLKFNAPAHHRLVVHDCGPVIRGGDEFETDTETAENLLAFTGNVTVASFEDEQAPITNDNKEDEHA